MGYKPEHSFLLYENTGNKGLKGAQLLVELEA